MTMSLLWPVIRHTEVSARGTRRLFSRCAGSRPKKARTGTARRGRPTRPPRAPFEISQERFCRKCRRPRSSFLTVSENGYGKRTSSFRVPDHRPRRQRHRRMAVNQRNGKLVASYAIENSDQIMLVTDGGQLIRCPVSGIRIVGRGSQGVIVFQYRGTLNAWSRFERVSGRRGRGTGRIEPAGRGLYRLVSRALSLNPLLPGLGACRVGRNGVRPSLLGMRSAARGEPLPSLILTQMK